MKARLQSSSTPTKRFRRSRENADSAKAWSVREAVEELRRYGTKRNVDGMARFGIRAKIVYGVSKPKMDEIARKIGKNHVLGLKLWQTGIHDARILGMLISEASLVTSGQMERWVRDLDNWDVCDGTCCHLFVDVPLAWKKAFAWSARKKEFEKRAGFALAAFLALHDKSADDRIFRSFLEVIEREAWDDRNFVRKAVNWALRNIGKRNRELNRDAITTAERIRLAGTRAGRWIAADALRELKSAAVQSRLAKKKDLAVPQTKEGLKIRRVRQTDAPRIAELSGQLGYPTPIRQMAARLKSALKMKNGACFVAETKTDGVIGWVHVSVTPLLEVERRAEINGLVVAEQVRSQGAGAKLLQAAEQWSRKMRCVGMSVRSSVLRERAHNFYLRQGYEHYKTQKAFRKTL